MILSNNYLFFEAKLSNRWNNDSNNNINNNNTNTNTNDNSGTNIMKPFGNSKECPFNHCDLLLLLQCGKLGHIPTNLVPNCNTLEKLIECSNYFGGNSGKYCINSTKLINYK